MFRTALFHCLLGYLVTTMYKMRRNIRTGGVIIPRKYFSRTGVKSIYSRRRKRTKFRSILAKKLAQNTGELKGVDADLTNNEVLSTTASSGGIRTLNLVETGNGSWNRIGRKIFLKSLRLKLILRYVYNSAPTTGTLFGSTMRVTVVWDKQPQEVKPNASDIIGQTSQDGTETSEPFDSLRYDNTGRFSILRDIYVTAKPTTQNTQGGTLDTIEQEFFIDEYIDLKNKTTIFSGQSDPTTIADISSGALYLMVNADRNTANQSRWSVASQSFSRLRFTS